MRVLKGHVARIVVSNQQKIRAIAEEEVKTKPLQGQRSHLGLTSVRRKETET